MTDESECAPSIAIEAARARATTVYAILVSQENRDQRVIGAAQAGFRLNP